MDILILASGSPRRTQLLTEFGIKHQVVVSSVEEILEHPGGPISLVSENAKLKALKVAKRYPEHLVLGADTIVSLNDRVLGKPGCMEGAVEMLLSLSGKTHLVSTAICLTHCGNGMVDTRVETSRVTFKSINKKTIDEYFNHVDPLDKAGAYAMQTRSDLIIDDFQGSRSNVIGLPMEMLVSWLKELGAYS